jgi:hypothetical protein
MLINIPDKSRFGILINGLIDENKETGRILTYSGVGPRLTPTPILVKMSYIAKRLEHQLFILYTGGADGADTAFLAGTQFFKVFLPSRIHGVRTANRQDVFDCTTLDNWSEALLTIDKYHPAPQCLGPFARKLMARNSYCVLGEDLQSPVDFVLTWTPNCALVGGTAQGLRIAMDYNIPIFNLADERVLADVLRVLKLNLFD